MSVTVSGDQTIFVGLGAEPQRCNHIVLAQSNVAVVLYQQRYREAFSWFVNVYSALQSDYRSLNNAPVSFKFFVMNFYFPYNSVARRSIKSKKVYRWRKRKDWFASRS